MSLETRRISPCAPSRQRRLSANAIASAHRYGQMKQGSAGA